MNAYCNKPNRIFGVNWQMLAFLVPLVILGTVACTINPFAPKAKLSEGEAIAVVQAWLFKSKSMERILSGQPVYEDCLTYHTKHSHGPFVAQEKGSGVWEITPQTTHSNNIYEKPTIATNYRWKYYETSGLVERLEPTEGATC